MNSISSETNQQGVFSIKASSKNVTEHLDFSMQKELRCTEVILIELNENWRQVEGISSKNGWNIKRFVCEINWLRDSSSCVIQQSFKAACSSR